ncbi:M20/M25/M40 family metallo-hydrolase [Piscibacillus halophilus]|uniref:M20/M25/M40 family metallo-hydrolase n=1 Tax=Piscibacillus halophilus TaxID=571933 RepID=UPI00210E89FF|nr:M20/M25/M40 family metallo-hydrolase [Piscibacillus halophilus]
MTLKWQTKEELVNSLCQLVQFKSISGEEGEVAIIEHVEKVLQDYPYFKEYPQYLQTDQLSDGRKLLTALVRGKRDTKKTIILLSHIDVVGVEDYGSLQDLAFNPKELTEQLRNDSQSLPEDVLNDLNDSQEWLFGRGTMDMKAGTTLHLSMVEKAMAGEWDGNILLLLVPDEEVNSAGMLKARHTVNQIKEKENLEFILCVNSEPMFRQFPQDEQMYIYTGSLGKVLPGFLCYGKETHVGEPFNGLNANLMLSYLNINLELSEELMEKVGEEVTPPPISLMNRDLKENYSVQTPLTAVSMYNILLMNRSVKEISEKLHKIMEQTKLQIESHISRQASVYADLSHSNISTSFDIKLLDYDTLYQEAVKRHGEVEVARRREALVNEREQGDRDFSTLLVQDLAYLCKDLAPMMVLFYSPPYYPAVTSHSHPLVNSVGQHVTQLMEREGQHQVKTIQYFNGISDLSFIGEDNNSKENLDELYRQMPLKNNGDSFLKYLEEELVVPSINIGPIGKDAHQWTERLNVDFSFGELPHILSEAIKFTFENH